MSQALEEKLFESAARDVHLVERLKRGRQYETGVKGQRNGFAGLRSRQGRWRPAAAHLKEGIRANFPGLSKVR